MSVSREKSNIKNQNGNPQSRQSAGRLTAGHYVDALCKMTEQKSKGRLIK